MEKPDKPDLRGLNIDKFGETTRESVRKTFKNGATFLKKAKAAFQGDEKAREELADAVSNAWVKTGDAILDVADRTGQKIVEKAAELEKKREQRPKP